MATRDIIVIGASAGGITALMELMHDLPADLPAVICVTVHCPSERKSELPRILARAGALPADHPEDGVPLRHGRVYVAPPGRHLLIGPAGIELTRGPRVHGFRPAIDPLFESAAQAFGQRVIGVILSGMLDDGALGLQRVKRNGGLAVVQQPEDALFPDMPRSACQQVAVDHIVPVAQMGALLTRLVGDRPPAEPDQARSSVDAGGGTVERAHGDRETTRRVKRVRGKPVNFACPDCGGVLEEIERGDLVQYSCRVDHTYSEETLFSTQSEAVERALWAAVRALEERQDLVRRISNRYLRQGEVRLAQRFEELAREAEENGLIIRQVLEESDVVAGMDATDETASLDRPTDEAGAASGVGNGTGDGRRRRKS